MTFSNLSDDDRKTNRIAPRHGFDSRVTIHVQKGGEKRSLVGWARDLSESGLGAFVAETLTLGAPVTLEIPMPPEAAQLIPARVIRALGTEYGFQFTALSAEQRRHILSTLQGRPAIPYDASKK
jgi:hypothetical protein